MDKVGTSMYSPKDHICRFLHQMRPKSTFTVSGDRRKSSEEFVNGFLELANGLIELGISNGDVVAIASLNSEWYMEWLMAVAYIGAIVAPLNYRWSLEEAREAVELVKPVMVVVDENCNKWIAGLQGPSVMLTVLIGESSSVIVDCNHNERRRDVCNIKRPVHRIEPFNYQWAPREVALVCFTSGTTGRPKGVAISHTALVVQARAKITVVGYSDDDVYLHTAPLCHIGGLSSCIAMLMAGGCHVFIPRFDAKLAVEAIEENHVTALITVPTMLSDLITVLRRQSRVHFLDSVKKVLNGAGSLSSELISSATSIFPNATLISAYGMTEACSSLTFLTLHDPKSPSRGMYYDQVRSRSQLGGCCVGRSPPHVDLQILHESACYDEDASCQRTPFTIGRILTRGSHVMVGYWGSNSVFGEGDWLDTGDVGWIDDVSGKLWLLGRTNDRIKSGGENVYPQEVESVLCQHPGVLSAAVFGIPDRRLTEMVVACVRPRENWEWSDQNKEFSPDTNGLSREILHKYCIQKNLTRFKLPKLYIPWRKPFPSTSTGKLKREEVKKELMLRLLDFLPSNL